MQEMGMHRSLLPIIAAAMIALSGCQTDSDPKDRVSPRSGASPIAPGEFPPFISTLTPYPTPKASKMEAPEGFEPVFAEHVARHGARALTDGGLLDDTIALWEEARDADALTEAGERFGPDARALRAAMEKVGFSQLSTLGKEEMRGLGARTGKRLSGMFDAAIEDGAKVELIDSEKERAVDSARNFAVGLRSAKSDLKIQPTKSDEKLLKFDNENDEYENFLEDGDWKSAYNQVRKLSGIDEAAVDTLEHLYEPDFVAGINRKLFYANGIYDVYRGGPAMGRDINVDTTNVMPAKAAEAFAYVDDGRFFYSRGPGIEGDDGSYQAAQILLDDFFDEIDDRLLGRDRSPRAAVYRFAHAEEITPFAAMLQLPGADEPGKPGEIYTYENNDFRISRIAPLSANIEWVVWAKGDTHLVSVAHNEVPTTVGRDCQPYEDTKRFYELEELRTCLGATG
jgi:hypothetical protein